MKLRPAQKAKRLGWSFALVAFGAAWIIIAARHRIGAPYWLDEGISIQASHMGWREIVTAQRIPAGSTMTAFHLLLLPYTRLFGETPIAVHSLSILATIVGVALLGLYGSRLGGRRVGVIAVLLFASNPVQILEAANARSYAFQPAILCLIAFACVWAAHCKHSLRFVRYGAWAVVGGLVGFSLWWSPVLALAAVAMMGPLMLCALSSRVTNRVGNRLQVPSRSAMLVFSGAALTVSLPQLLLLRRSWMSSFRWQPKITPSLAARMFGHVVTASPLAAAFWLLGIVGAVQCARICLTKLSWETASERAMLAWIALSWLVGFPLLLVVTDQLYPLGVERYAQPVLGPLVLFASYAMDGFLAKFPNPIGQARKATRRMVPVLMSSFIGIGIAFGPRAAPYPDWRPTFAFAQDRFGPDDAVAFVPSYIRMGWDATIVAGMSGIARGTPVLPPVPWGQFGPYWNITVPPTGKQVAAYKRLWVIRSIDTIATPVIGMELFGSTRLHAFIVEDWRHPSLPDSNG